MSRRVTVVGKLFFMPRDEHDRERAIAEVVESLERTGGNVSRAAHELCISTRHLYRIIWRANLWAVVDAARLRYVVENIRTEPDWIKRTRRELR